MTAEFGYQGTEDVDTLVTIVTCATPGWNAYNLNGGAGYLPGTNNTGDEEVGTILITDGLVEITHAWVPLVAAITAGNGDFQAHIYSFDTTATDLTSALTLVASSTPVSASNLVASNNSFSANYLTFPNPPAIDGVFAVTFDVVNSANDTVILWTSDQNASCGNSLAIIKESNDSISQYVNLWGYDAAIPMGVVTDNTIGTEENVLGSSFVNAFPNPATDKVNFTFDLAANAEVTLTVMDIQGRVVKQINESQVAGEQFMEMNVSDLTAGTYFYSVQAGDQAMNGKFVVRR
ncbi:MAG: T9SS type A sorting domain-containing protein [Oceanospirillaceae bacterium]|nr:T9SS type A sorting domain-containing protein [Oceanospirillaceae bacterium]